MTALAATLAATACVTARSQREPDPVVTEPGPTAGPDGVAPPRWQREAPPAVQRFAAANRSLGEALRRAGGGCDAVAQALDAWTRAHGEEFRAATAAMDAWERTADRSVARRYHELMERDVDARVSAGVRCDGDPVARAAFERFFAAVGFDGG